MGNDLDVPLTTKSAGDGAGRRRPHLPHLVRHRGRLRLRLRRGLGRRRRHLGHGRRTTAASTPRHWAGTQTVDLSAYEGKSVLVRFEYFTDGGVAPRGWEVTDIRVGGDHPAASPRGRPTAGCAWTASGRRRRERYYIAEYRTHDGFDASLKNCYQWNCDYANWVDWFSYNKGLHLIYRDTFYADNDVAMHHGRGGWMVVDAHPKPDGVAYSDGADDYYGYWRPRIQVRDAAFSLKPTTTQSVYFVDYDQGWGVGEDVVPGKAAQPTFNDGKTYWYAEAPEAGVKIPKNLGVRIIVKSMNDDAMTIRVDNVK